MFWNENGCFFVLKDKIFAPAAQTLAPEVIWSPSAINIKWSRTEQHIQKLDEWVQCELEVFLWRSAAGAKIFRIVPCQKTFLQCKNGVCERWISFSFEKQAKRRKKKTDFELTPPPCFQIAENKGGVTVTARLSGFSLKGVFPPFWNRTFAHLSECALKWVFVDFSDTGAECSVKWVLCLTYPNHNSIRYKVSDDFSAATRHC